MSFSNIKEVMDGLIKLGRKHLEPYQDLIPILDSPNLDLELNGPTKEGAFIWFLVLSEELERGFQAVFITHFNSQG